jgi:calcineurin-like phosphoesterase family protein
VIKFDSISKVFITSDEHYGSQRTLELSRRPFKTTEEMDEHMIKCFNSKVPEDGITIHNGDFGNMDILKKLNGRHILIWGNYEFQDFIKDYRDPETDEPMSEILVSIMKNQYKWGDMTRAKNPIDKNSKYGKFLKTAQSKQKIFNTLLRHKYGWTEVYGIYPTPCQLVKFNDSDVEYNVTHRPLDCDIEKSNKNLYGHIHGRQLVKRYGMDVGVDGHHFYPLSMAEDIPFFMTAIEKFYDNNVFE